MLSLHFIYITVKVLALSKAVDVTLPCGGTFDLSRLNDQVILQSHEGGNGVNNIYPVDQDQDCEWTLTHGNQCAESDFFCKFFTLQPQDDDGSCSHKLEIDGEEYVLQSPLQLIKNLSSL